MSVPVVGVFGLKGGTGRTTLVYHLAWILSEMGIRTLAVDLDPQCVLTELFFGVERLSTLMDEDQTVYSCYRPAVEGSGKIVETPPVHQVSERLGVVAGDTRLFLTEEPLGDAFRGTTKEQSERDAYIASVASIIQHAAAAHGSQIVLVDMAPSVSALNKVAFVAMTHVLVPAVPEPLSLLSLAFVGKVVHQWQSDWAERRAVVAASFFAIPSRSMVPIGYVVVRLRSYGGRPVRSSQEVLEQMPSAYRRAFFETTETESMKDAPTDPWCLGQVLPYGVLMQTAAELNKPVFDLKPADGAMGSLMTAAQRARQDFEHLGRAILSRVGVPLP